MPFYRCFMPFCYCDAFFDTLFYFCLGKQIPVFGIYFGIFSFFLWFS